MTQPARLGSHAVFGARKTWRRSLFAGLLGLLGVPGCSALAKTDQCEVNTDCIYGRGMPSSICNADKRCVSVLSPDCKELVGAPLESDPLLIAHMTHFSGTNSNYGDASKVSVQVALEDFKTFGQRIPTDPARPLRQMSVLLCDEAVDAMRTARHVTDDLRLPVLIGPVVSATTLKVAQEITIPGQTLMINPFSVSDLITTLEDDGLVWRTAVTNREEGLGMAKFVQDYVEAKLLKQAPYSGEQTRVAVINKPDVYGRRLTSHFQAEAKVNGCSPATCRNFIRDFEYPDEKGAASSFTADMLDQVIAHQPNVIMLLGTSEMAEYVMSGIEAKWPTLQPVKRPIYVLSEAVKTKKLLDLVDLQASKDSELKKRVYLFGPKLNEALKSQFMSKWPRIRDANNRPPDPKLIDVYGTTGTYDALYLTAYAAVALLGEPFTGPNLAQALKKMVRPPGAKDIPTIPVGDTSISDAYTKLNTGGNIDIDGITSPLDFDIATGDAPGKYDVQCCRQKDGDYVSTGLTFDTGTKALTEDSSFKPCS